MYHRMGVFVSVISALILTVCITGVSIAQTSLPTDNPTPIILDNSVSPATSPEKHQGLLNTLDMMSLDGYTLQVSASVEPISPNEAENTDGRVQELSSAGVIPEGIEAIPWENGYTTGFVLSQSMSSDSNGMLVANKSTQYPSATIARQVFKSLGTAQVKRSTDILDKSIEGSLGFATDEWSVFESQEDGMAVFTILLLSGSYVNQIEVAVLEVDAQAGRNLVNQLVKRLTAKYLGNIQSFSLFLPVVSIGEDNITRASSGYRWANPYTWSVRWKWERRWGIWVYRPHYLATWRGYVTPGTVKYNGPGWSEGNCTTNHGCINTWTWWWHTYFSSALGVPSTLLFTNGHAWDLWNYQAQVNTILYP